MRTLIKQHDYANIRGCVNQRQQGLIKRVHSLFFLQHGKHTASIQNVCTMHDDWLVRVSLKKVSFQLLKLLLKDAVSFVFENQTAQCKITAVGGLQCVISVIARFIKIEAIKTHDSVFL